MEDTFLVTLSNSWKFYKENFNKILQIVLWPFVISLILTIVQIWAGSPTTEQEFLNSIWVNKTFTTIFLVISFLVFIYSVVAKLAVILFSSRKISAGEQNGVWESYKKVLILLPSFVWIEVLICFILLGSFTALIIPGIFFCILLLFPAWALFVENKKGISSLLSSWSLVKGRWWRTFGKMILLSLAIIIILIVLSIVLQFVTAGNIYGTSAYISSSVSSGLGSILIMPLMIIFLSFWYESLRKSRVDVEEADKTKKRKITLWVFAIIGLILLVVLSATSIYLISLMLTSFGS